MAGGTNRAFKAAGLPKAAIKDVRLVGGRGLKKFDTVGMSHERASRLRRPGK